MQKSDKDKDAGWKPAPQKTGETPAPQSLVKKVEPPLTLGSCVLRRPEVAEIVQNALLYFEGTRYFLGAWCIMPNHVHVVFTPLGVYLVSAILHSWKSYTANRINKLIGAKGALWERESFNHLIRKADHLQYYISYTENNPVAAGLCASPSDWPFSSAGFQSSSYCGAGFQPASFETGGGATPPGNSDAGWKPAPQWKPAPIEIIDPRRTPFAPIKSRGELPHLDKESGTYFATFRLLDAVELAKG